jgi:hypothetical protein
VAGAYLWPQADNSEQRYNIVGSKQRAVCGTRAHATVHTQAAMAFDVYRNIVPRPGLHCFKTHQHFTSLEPHGTYC